MILAEAWPALANNGERKREGEFTPFQPHRGRRSRSQVRGGGGATCEGGTCWGHVRGPGSANCSCAPGQLPALRRPALPPPRCRPRPPPAPPPRPRPDPRSCPSPRPRPPRPRPRPGPPGPVSQIAARAPPPALPRRTSPRTTAAGPPRPSSTLARGGERRRKAGAEPGR